MRYDTIQQAVGAVPTDGTPTTVVLLKNIVLTERIEVNTGQNVIFDFQNFAITNRSDVTNMPIIENKGGTVSMSNGRIEANITQGVINNKLGGSFTMSGGTIIATGTRQALYNEGNSYTEITGSAYLKATTNQRAAVQNVSGTMLITGGTIISTGYSAITNTSTLTIGVKDGNVNTSSPLIQGIDYGIRGDPNKNTVYQFRFYDGIVKYITDIYERAKETLVDSESGYGFYNGTETIGGQTYQIAYLGVSDTVTFNPSGGNVTETTRSVINGCEVGPLPTPTKSGYDFVGWFTVPQGQSGGTQVSANTVITGDVTFYAYWQKVDIASINGTRYATLKAAIEAVAQNNVQVTIDLINDTTENVTIKANQNIILNLQNHTMRNTTTTAVIENNGTVTVTNGTITSNVNTAVINNNSGGYLTIDGASIISTGTRQAIYNNGGGTVEIKANSYLSSTATGKPSGTNMERGTIQNLTNGTLIISGGTIIGVNQQAVSNEGTLTIGVSGGGVSTTVPEIRGKTYGVKTTTAFSFYDGILKGRTDAISGSISNVETGYQKADDTEVIDGETYKTAYLELIP